MMSQGREPDLSLSKVTISKSASPTALLHSKTECGCLLHRIYKEVYVEFQIVFYLIPL